MAVDLEQAAWLKSESLDVLATPAGGVAWSADRANDAEFTSPLDARADAATEAARTIAILAGPNAKERIIVKGRRRDLLFKCVEVSFARLGYAPSATSELVVNGDGSSASGWTAERASLSSVGGLLRVTNTAGFGRAYQSFATQVGRKYMVRASAFAGTAPPQFRLGSADDAFDLALLAAGNHAFVFTALSAATHIAAYVNSATVGQYADFDNISVRPVNRAVFVIGAAENDDGTTALTVIRKL